MHTSRLVWICVCLFIPGWALGDTAELIELATQGASSDAQRAQRLVEAAARLNEPEVRKAFYRKAFELGTGHINGVPFAQQALDALAKLEEIPLARLRADRLKVLRLLYARGTPAQRRDSADDLLDLLLEEARAKLLGGPSGEALALYREASPLATALKRRHLSKLIIERMREASARVTMENRVQSLELSLRDSENPHLRREYILLCVVELDDPARAKAAAEKSGDPALQTYVPLAAQSVQSIQPKACLELAQWYDSLWAKATRVGQILAWQRAVAYYSRALAAGDLEGLSKIKVEQDLKRLSAALESALQADRPFLDLLAMVQMDKDVVAGTWKASDRGLLSDDGACSRIMLPYRVGDEYDLRVEFTRHSDAGTVAVPLCHGKHLFVFECGWGAGEAGFAYIDGKHIDRNPTGAKWTIVKDRRHLLVIQVRKEGLRAVADGRAIVSWKTDYQSVTPHPGWALGDRACIGLGSFRAPTTFHTAELVEITGAGKRLR